MNYSYSTDCHTFEIQFDKNVRIKVTDTLLCEDYIFIVEESSILFKDHNIISSPVILYKILCDGLEKKNDTVKITYSYNNSELIQLLEEKTLIINICVDMIYLSDNMVITLPMVRKDVNQVIDLICKDNLAMKEEIKTLHTKIDHLYYILSERTVNNLNLSIKNQGVDTFKKLISYGCPWTEESISILLRQGTYEMFQYWKQYGLFINGNTFGMRINNGPLILKWNTHANIYDNFSWFDEIISILELERDEVGSYGYGYKNLIMFAVAYCRVFNEFKLIYDKFRHVLLYVTNPISFSVKRNEQICITQDMFPLISCDKQKLDYILQETGIVITTSIFNPSIGVIEDIDLIKHLLLLPIAFKVKREMLPRGIDEFVAQYAPKLKKVLSGNDGYYTIS